MPETITENSLAVDPEGKVVEYLVDDFEKDYYSVEGLTEMVKAEAKEYNGNHISGEGQPIHVLKVEKVADGSDRVLVNREYNNSDTYRVCTGNKLYYGTVAQMKEALEQVDSTMTFTGVKKKDTVTLFQVLAMTEKHVIITDVPANFYCPNKVEYISQGLTIRDDGSGGTATGANSVVGIVRKK